MIRIKNILYIKRFYEGKTLSRLITLILSEYNPKYINIRKKTIIFYLIKVVKFRMSSNSLNYL